MNESAEGLQNERILSGPEAQASVLVLRDLTASRPDAGQVIRSRRHRPFSDATMRGSK